MILSRFPPHLSLLFLLVWSGFSCTSAPVSIQPSETVTILGINDVHGALLPRVFQTNENPSVAYEVGGAAVFASYVQVLKNELGSSLILVDAGDQWQGTLESNLEKGAPVVRVFNQIGIQAAALGNHEFDFGRKVLDERLSEAKYPTLTANVFDKNTGKLAALPNTQPTLLLRAGRSKVGLIGLSTVQTPTTTDPTQVTDLEFRDMKDIVLHHARELRNQGADYVVAIAHSGTKCAAPPQVSPLRKNLRRTHQTPQGPCDDSDEIVRLLRTIPKGTLDGLIAGHTHQIQHHWINGTPVMQSGSSLQHFSLLHLNPDRAQTAIEGPIPVCPKVFQNQDDCDGRAPPPTKGRGPLVAPTFRGVTISPDPNIGDLLQDTLARTASLKARIVGKSELPLQPSRLQESALANLVADAVRSKIDADFALVNPGGLRAPIEAGSITYEQVFRTLPFDNTISRLEVTGAQLKDILRVAFCGARGLFGVSGLQIRMIDPGFRAPHRDLNRDGKISHWEINRILDIRLPDGKKIQDSRLYTLATLDFLVRGGDDMAWPMDRIPRDRVQMDAGGLTREAVVDYLGKNSPVHTAARPLVAPDRPRIILTQSGARLKKSPADRWR